jgi:hypothetical protein
MAIVQALLAFVGRSVGKILYAIFGWAVRALFGYSSGARRTLLTALVALAALWPLLLLGVAVPRVAAFLIAFVPVPDSVDEGWLRAGWIAASLLVPTLVGTALATQAAEDAPPEAAWKRVLRGYPITLGISSAFWISFVSVPLQQIATRARGLEDSYIPLVTSPRTYSQAAARIEAVLNDHGFALQPATPGFWTRAPLRVLRWFAGDSMQNFVPDRLAYLRGDALVAALYPSGLLLRGSSDDTALAHGLAVEALTNTDAYQTTDADAQQFEREIRRVWRVFELNPAAHESSPWLVARLEEIARDLTRSKIPYDDWQIVYRQILQLSRALRGEAQLLDGKPQREGDAMSTQQEWLNEDEFQASAAAGAGLSTTELLKEITSKAALLARKEIELARAEIKSDFESELAMVKTLGVAAVFGITTLNLLFVAGVFALARTMDGWLAALLVAAVTLLIAVGAGVYGWSRRVTRPLERTRRTLEEDVKWAKERLA